MLLFYIGVGNRVLVNGKLKPLKQVNRDAACAGFVPLAPPNTSCDEYPFATTFQGGSSASVRAVPPAEQSLQGTLLQQFYHKNQVDKGGYGPFLGEFNPFAVVPVII
jgi:hypothetical protein